MRIFIIEADLSLKSIEALLEEMKNEYFYWNPTDSLMENIEQYKPDLILISYIESENLPSDLIQALQYISIQKPLMLLVITPTMEQALYLMEQLSELYLNYWIPYPINLTFLKMKLNMINNFYALMKDKFTVKVTHSYNNELLLINSIIMMLNSTLELDKILNIAVQRMCEIANVTVCNVILLKDNNQKIGMLAAEYDIRFPDAFSKRSNIHLEEHPAIQKAIYTRCPIIIEDAESTLSCTYSTKSLAVFPLITKKKIIGLLTLHSIQKPKYFTPQEIELTQIVSNQIAIALANAQLFENIQNQRDELKKANEQLQELNQLKQNLMTMIIHDLRTPLTGVIVYLELLEKLFKEENKREKKYLQIALKSSNDLLYMINNLMDIAKMETSNTSLNKQPTSSKNVVYSALTHIDGLIKSNKQNLILNIDGEIPPVMMDKEKIIRVLINLLGNAVKFTPRDGTITITTLLVNDVVEFQIKDTGEGIPMDYLTRIFDKFEQVKVRNKGKEMSSGLGLTFCKLAVKAHNGKIWAESELGKGSTFIFQIPLN